MHRITTTVRTSRAGRSKEANAGRSGTHAIYIATNTEVATEFDAFEQSPWGSKFPLRWSLGDATEIAIPSFALSPTSTPVVYATSLIESKWTPLRRWQAVQIDNTLWLSFAMVDPCRMGIVKLPLPRSHQDASYSACEVKWTGHLSAGQAVSSHSRQMWFPASALCGVKARNRISNRPSSCPC